MQAKDLISADLGGTSDPYVTITVGAGGHSAPYYQYHTKVVKKTLAPVYNEEYNLMLDPKQRRGILSIQVFDKDNVGKDDSLGKVEIPMHTLTPLEDYDVWHTLISENDEHQSKQTGQVQLIYKLIPKLPPAMLLIEIVRAKDLLAADSGGTSDPYVRVHVGDEIDKAKKTKIKKKDLNAEWKEKFELSIRSEQRRDVLNVECFDHDAISADDSLGQFKIALDDLEPGKEYEEWR